MKLETMIGKGAEVLLGLYLMAPGPEDAASGGATVLPSMALGAMLIADAFDL